MPYTQEQTHYRHRQWLRLLGGLCVTEILGAGLFVLQSWWGAAFLSGLAALITLVTFGIRLSDGPNPSV